MVFTVIWWFLAQQLEVEYKDRLEQKCHREKVIFAEYRVARPPLPAPPERKAPSPTPPPFTCGGRNTGMSERQR